MTMCDGRDDIFSSGCGIKNTVTIDTDRHKGLGGGAGEALFKGRYSGGDLHAKAVYPALGITEIFENVYA